jgi:hypothetical protein
MITASPDIAVATDSSPVQKYRRRLSALKDERSGQGWDSHWRELVDYFAPGRGRYLRNENELQHNDGRKKHSKIINGSSIDARRTLAGGLQGGLTSPTRPWFRLTLQDQDLAESGPVKKYLSAVRNVMLAVFARSNFYGSTHSIYDELGVFGTGGMLLEEDPKTVIRARPFTIGEFYLALDSYHRPETMYRQFVMSVEQLVEKFDWEMLPSRIRQDYASGFLDRKNEVVHVIEPNSNKQNGRADHRGMDYKSCYFLLSGGDGASEGMLREKGYRGKPFVAPRWDVVGVDVYGQSPGMAALGDVKMLQKLEEKKLKALDKQVDPPMIAPAGMRASGVSLIPGAVNFVDEVAGSTAALKPMLEVRFDHAGVRGEIEAVERRIQRFFFNDLFLSIINQTKEMTAEEVARRHEEKLTMLGPIIERLDAEFLDPIIDRAYEICNSYGILPEPPPEIQGTDLKVEYISLLAQAQKMVSMSSIREFTGFVLAHAQANPGILDKVDFDQTADEVADILGVPPTMVRDDKSVAELRQAREQQDQAARMAAAAAPAAEAAGAAKDLSETKLSNGKSALDQMLGG